MDRKKVCAVYDTKSGTYGNLMLFLTLGEAIRSFGDAVNNKDTIVAQHPEDFRLEHLADYDLMTGLIEPVLPSPAHVVEANQLVKK